MHLKRSAHQSVKAYPAFLFLGRLPVRQLSPPHGHRQRVLGASYLAPTYAPEIEVLGTVATGLVVTFRPAGALKLAAKPAEYSAPPASVSGHTRSHHCTQSIRQWPKRREWLPGDMRQKPVVSTHVLQIPRVICFGGLFEPGSSMAMRLTARPETIGFARQLGSGKPAFRPFPAAALHTLTIMRPRTVYGIAPILAVAALQTGGGIRG